MNVCRKKLYLIRHGQAERQEEHRCISQTDLPLSAVGLEQARALAMWTQKRSISAVYTSPLRRCTQTAALVADKKSLYVVPELTEVSVGDWEGLTFAQIKQDWKFAYEQRGRAIGTSAPPNGESFQEAGVRMESAMQQIVKKTSGDAAIVSHAGIIRGWLCRVLGISSNRVFELQIPNASVTEVLWIDGRFVVVPEMIGQRCAHVPGSLEIRAYYRCCQTPPQVQRHGDAVAKKALALAAGAITECRIDQALLAAAARLHDAYKLVGREHPQRMAALLKADGYQELADVVAAHHDLPKSPMAVSTEAELLYLADKLICGTTEVSLSERFARARQHCADEQALAAWQKRYDDARRIAEKYRLKRD